MQKNILFYLITFYCLLLLTFSSYGQLESDHWLLTCGNTSDRVYTCSPSEDVVVINVSSYNISNCHFINCPVVMVDQKGWNVTLTITNVTFEGGRGAYGGTVRFDAGFGFLNNVTIIGAQALVGAALYIASANVTVTNGYFYNNMATGLSTSSGGAVWVASDNVHTFVCTNCYFDGNQAISGTNGGGAMHASYIDCYLTNVRISHNNGYNGGAILFQRANLIIKNMYAYNNTAVNFGGGLELENGNFNCTNCTFEANFAFKASAVFLDTMNINWNGGAIKNQNAGYWAAGILANTKVTGNIQNVLFKNLHGDKCETGGCLFVNGFSNLVLSDIVVEDVSVTVQGAFAYLWSSNVLTCYRCKLNKLSSGYIGGVAILLSNSSLHFYDSQITNIETASQGALYLSDSCTATLNNHTIFDGATALWWYGSMAEVLKSTFICHENSTMRNGTAPDSGGCIDIGPDSTVILDSCNIEYCTATNNGGAIRNMGNLIINGSTIISNVHSKNGGALYASGASQSSFEDSFQIINASADVCGSTISADTTAQLTFNGNDWKIFPFPSSTPGTFLCLQQTDMTLIHFITTGKINVNGTIWIENVQASQDFIRLGTGKVFPESAQIYGGPSVLAWRNKPIIPARGLRPGEMIPAFSIQILDRWNHIAPLSPKQIILVNAISPNQTLSGETVRASLDFNFSTITFPNIAFVNASPGIYNLSIVPLAETLETEANDTFPTIEIKISLCNSDELFSTSNGGRCLPMKSINLATRIIFAILGVILFVIVILCSIGIFIYRELQLVKGSAPLFLWIMNLGVLLMGIALLAGMNTHDVGCVVRAWFENIGFLTIFIPLLLKTKRIEFIFQNDWAAKKKHANRLRTDYLLRHLGLAAALAITLMIIWTVLDPPRIDAPFFYTNYVVTGRCRQNQGDMVALIIRLIILLYAVELAISVRNAPSNYNESKVIGFTTYNWGVFTGIGSSVATFAIDDPEVAFIIASIAIFVPCLVHTLTMTGYKVFLCYLDPEAANVRHTGYSQSGPNVSGSNLQVTVGGGGGVGGSGSRGETSERRGEERTPKDNSGFYYGPNDSRREGGGGVEMENSAVQIQETTA